MELYPPKNSFDDNSSNVIRWTVISVLVVYDEFFRGIFPVSDHCHDSFYFFGENSSFQILLSQNLFHIDLCRTLKRDNPGYQLLPTVSKLPLGHRVSYSGKEHLGKVRHSCTRLSWWRHRGEGKKTLSTEIKSHKNANFFLQALMELGSKVAILQRASPWKTSKQYSETTYCPNIFLQ